MKIHPSKLIVSLFALCAACILQPQTAKAHCQIPCGIYDDHARVQSMLEDAATIKKATVKLLELSDQDDLQSLNQSIRWVSNKESHAQKIIASISDYFLTQRVKPSQEDYAERLAKHHAVIIAAMKTKQSVAGEDADALIKSIEALESYYPGSAHTH